MPVPKTPLKEIGITVLLLLLFTKLQAQQYGWKIIARPTSYRLYAVDFVDALHGWCAGKDTIYHTIDGGKTWKGVHGPTNADFTDLSFTDQSNGWAVGNFAQAAGLIWRTTDGGISWMEQVTPRMNRRYQGTSTQSLTHNTTVGTRFFFADTGLTIQTINGGSTWQERTIADSIAFISKITFIDPLHGWATAELRNAEGIILRTIDGGKTWQVLKTPSPFTAISFIDSARGWVRGVGVHTTRDGGMTWRFLGFNLSAEFYASTLSFIDSLSGWAFGAQFYQGTDTEAIYHTTDGGKSWSQESIGLTGDFGYITDARMLDKYHGWAVSYDGSVLSYLPTTSVAEKPDQAPRGFTLQQNYPNPFNSATTIQYAIPKRSPVTLYVYDVLGKLMTTLVNEIQEPGVYRVILDGSSFTSGTYLYELKAGELVAMQKMQLLK